MTDVYLAEETSVTDIPNVLSHAVAFSVVLALGAGRAEVIIRERLQHSPLLRPIVSRLEDSDVVVYVRCDERPPAGVIGRVTFVGRTAGVRRLLVRVGFIGDRHRQTAILGTNCSTRSRSPARRRLSTQPHCIASIPAWDTSSGAGPMGSLSSRPMWQCWWVTRF